MCDAQVVSCGPPLAAEAEAVSTEAVSCGPPLAAEASAVFCGPPLAAGSEGVKVRVNVRSNSKAASRLSVIFN